MMIFTPGPGTPVILMGLGLLAAEFVWARRLMRSTMRLAQTNSAASKPKPIKITGVPGPGVKIIIIPRSSNVNPTRSEEHTSELQSRLHLVCRLLLEKKKPMEWLVTDIDVCAGRCLARR